MRAASIIGRTALAPLLCGVSTTAFAQQEAAPPAAEAAQELPASTSEGGIVVTGSRLSVGGFNAPTPVTVLGEDQLKIVAPTNAAELINQVPAFRQSDGPTQAQRMSRNQNTLDLRGLGSERTLMLIDGRRQSTNDANTVPVALVKRVEVVTGGASAAYGSDAVAGVVNFLLDTDLEGVRANVQSGVSQYGDNEGYAINVAAGHSFANDRVHVLLGADYSDNKGVGTIYTRDWSRVQPNLVANGTGRAAGVPAQSLLDDITYSTQSIGGVINAPGALAGIAFGKNGAIYPFDYGTVIGSVMQGGSNYLGSSNGNWPMKVPLRRFSGLAHVSVDVSDKITLWGEGAYADVLSHGFTTFMQSPSNIIPVASPFIPDAIRPLIPAGTETLTVGRFLTELGGYDIPNKRRTSKLSGGITAKPFGDWALNAYYQYSKTDNFVRNETNIVRANYRAAVYSMADANGDPVCGPIATNPNLTAGDRAHVLPGCVPINIFGVGAPSQAALDYITGNGIENKNDLFSTSHIVAASASGTLLHNWAGPVSMAIGAEARWDEEVAVTDEISLYNGWAASNGAQYSGRQFVKEAFAEVGVPLLADAPFARSLDLNGAIRVTDYRTSGTVTTWKLGATWEPADFMRLRVTRSRDIRAPMLRELYRAGGGGTYANIVNPINGQTGSLQTVGAGNTDLRPEIAKTWTGGVVLTPPGTGLRASVDYFDIKIDGVIATPSVQQVLQRCANGIQAFCDRITFDNSTFGISFVLNQPANLNRLYTNGLDFELLYSTGVGEGDLTLRGLATKIFHLTTYEESGVLDRAGSAQNGGIPSWVGTADITYERGAFSGTLGVRYFNDLLFDAALIGPDDPNFDPALSNSINNNELPGRTYFDLSTRVRVLDTVDHSAEFYFNVRNLFDKDPPSSALVLTSGNPYDVVGRTFMVGFRYTM